jgi:hypothetical protein
MQPLQVYSKNHRYIKTQKRSRQQEGAKIHIESESFIIFCLHRTRGFSHRNLVKKQQRQMSCIRQRVFFFYLVLSHGRFSIISANKQAASSRAKSDI